MEAHKIDQSHLLSKSAAKGVSVRLRECWVNKDNLRESCDKPGIWYGSTSCTP